MRCTHLRRSAILLVLGLFAAMGLNNTYGADWRRISPDSSESDELDLDSLRATASSDYTGRYRQRYFSVDSYQLIGIEVPLGSALISYIRGNCAHGATMFVTREELVSAEGQVIYSETPDQSIKDDELALNENYLKDVYGENTPSYACAALAARCAGRVFKWPLPQIGGFNHREKNPLYGWMEFDALVEKSPAIKNEKIFQQPQNQAKDRQLYIPHCKLD